MADFRYVICDVFTDRPLEGNPLAVFTDARGIPDALLQPCGEVGRPFAHRRLARSTGAGSVLVRL